MPCLGFLRMQWSAMHQGWLSFFSEFNCDICHLLDAENVVADALFCPGPDPNVAEVLSTLSLPIFRPEDCLLFQLAWVTL